MWRRVVGGSWSTMGTRTSFRPRPVDINKPLPIVRDLSELDAQDGVNGEKLQDVKVHSRMCF